MGFGFNFGMITIILPLSILLLVLWWVSRKSEYGKALGIVWILIILLVIFSSIARLLFKKKKLRKKDFYGEYIIDRDFFKGRQADWQYEHFRFEITKNDSIFFYVTEQEKVVEVYRGIITTLKGYRSERLVIKMEQPTYHVMTGNPTIYRGVWDFYLVFKSTKFNNMFFRKGEWKMIEEYN